MRRHKLLFILGTRPEAIKCAPVILACKADPDLDTLVLTTSQHRELQDSVLHLFDIVADHDLDLMRERSDLKRLVADAWLGLSTYLEQYPPDLILVQGDTTTAFIAALTAFYHKIAIAHIEAGLRTYDHTMPFPEEGNRRLITHIADLHFAPTPWAASNLEKEGIDYDDVYIVGNSGIDALLLTQEHLAREGPPKDYPPIDPNLSLVLVTSHRRENWGQNLRNICSALRTLTERHQSVQIVFLTHPNPEVSQIVHEMLGDRPRIIVHNAVAYPVMVHLLTQASAVLTDSGGLQEETPALGKPVLVLREKTERPEGVEHGAAILVGTDPERIVIETEKVLYDASYRKKHGNKISPYGDGETSDRIRQAVRYHFGLGERPADFLLE